TTADVNVNAPFDQAPTMAPPTRTGGGEVLSLVMVIESKVKENQENDKIGSKPDKKGEAWRSPEKSKAVAVNRERKTEESKSLKG
nr:hypothetical protein [Tanacetum cinerariifolium]